MFNWRAAFGGKFQVVRGLGVKVLWAYVTGCTIIMKMKIDNDVQTQEKW